MQHASVKYLVSELPLRSGQILAFTSGGRTVNERPYEGTIKYGADIDISSAYGSQLLNLVISIGRPTIYKFIWNILTIQNL